MRRPRYAIAADVDHVPAADDWCIEAIEEAVMFYPAETILALAMEKQQDLIADADRHRLLRSARRARRQRAAHRATPAREPLSRGRPAGTLAA
jgi:hypothetical protein